MSYNFNDSYNDEIRQLINNDKHNYFHLLKLDFSNKYKKSFEYLLRYIANNSPIIFQNPKYNIKCAIEWVLNKRTCFPKCAYCGNELTADNFDMHINTYSLTCSRSCTNKLIQQKYTKQKKQKIANKRLKTMNKLYLTTSTQNF